MPGSIGRVPEHARPESPRDAAPRRRHANALCAAAAVASALLVAEAGAGDPAKAVRRGTYVYVHTGNATNQVHGFRWEKDGKLTPLQGSPFATGLSSVNCTGNCQTLGYSAKSKALVASGGGASVSVLRVAAGGALSLGANSPFPLPGATGSSIGVNAVDRGKRTFVYANAFSDDKVHGLAVGPDGALSVVTGSPWGTGDAPDGMAATKRHVFTVNDNVRTISAFAVGADGALVEAPGSPFPTGTGFSFNLHTDIAGRRLYVGDVNDGDIAVHTIDRRTAALAQVPGSPSRLDTTNAGSGVAFLSKQLAVIVPTSGTLGIQSARVARTGLLTALGGLQNLQFGTLTAHARSPNGKFLALAQGTTVRTLAVNAKSGAITAVDSETLTGSVQGLRVVVR